MPAETHLAIAPLTPVFFGDGRPNDAGETDFGAGCFPPSPQTIQGVVRTTLLRSVDGLDLGSQADKERIRALVGPPEHLPEGWAISGPWPAKWKEPEEGVAEALSPWLPCPAWVLRDRDGKPFFATPCRSSARTDRGQGRILFTGQGGRLRGWLSPGDALRLLRGELPDRPAVELPPFVGREPHTGLRLTPGARTAEDGMLYTLDFHRFEDHSGLLLRFAGALDPVMKRTALTRRVSSLGGKNRVARLIEVRGMADDAQRVFAGDYLPAAPADGSRFLVWATTLVRVADPLAPGLDRLTVGRARLDVISAAVGAPLHLGGFSLARGQGGISHRYHPAGSAWLVAVRGGQAEDRAALLRELHDTCALGDDASERAFGFGHALVALPPPHWSHT